MKAKRLIALALANAAFCGKIEVQQAWYHAGSRRSVPWGAAVRSLYRIRRS